MRNKDYWIKRSETIANSQFDKADKYRFQLELEYLEAQNSIKKDIEVFYARFANNNEISLVDARKMLNANELREFKMTLDEFKRKAKNNPDGVWTQELNNVYYKRRVSRLQALQSQIDVKLNTLYSSQLQGTTKLLKSTYKDTYYRNIFEVHKGLGIGVNFAKIDDKAIDKVLSNSWLESNYSSRIWSNRNKLVNELKTNLIQSFIRGDSIDRTRKFIAERMGVAKNRARTLVNTESAYITQQATFDGYLGSGIVKQYEILATLDSHTSNICRSLDGKVFNISEKEIGVNAPPFHANCRTTTVAYFPDSIDEERIARDSDGKVYYVDGNMNYEQWYNKHVENNGNSDIIDKSTSSWSDFSIENKQFSSKREISKYLGSEYDIKFSDSRKYPIDKDLLQDSVNWLDKFNSYFDGFKEINPVELPEFKIKADIKPVGYYRYYTNSPGAVELALNGQYFTDKAFNTDYIKRCIETGWTVPNAKGHKTFVHEYGHHIANSLKWLDSNSGKVNQNWCKDFISETIKDYNVKYNKEVSFKEISKLVSEYGGSKPEETFAETFAEYFGGENPREFAKIFGEKVESKLNKYIREGVK